MLADSPIIFVLAGVLFTLVTAVLLIYSMVQLRESRKRIQQLELNQRIADSNPGNPRWNQ